MGKYQKMNFWYDVNTAKKPDFPYECYGKFDLDEMDESECMAEFRFLKKDIPLLFEALQWPDTTIRSPCSRAKHDFKSCIENNLSSSSPPNKPLERSPTKPTTSWDLCSGYSLEGKPTHKLFWFHWWNSEAYL